MSVNKECFEALVQSKVEKIKADHTNIEQALPFSLAAVRKKTRSSTVDKSHQDSRAFRSNTS